MGGWGTKKWELIDLKCLQSVWDHTRSVRTESLHFGTTRTLGYQDSSGMVPKCLETLRRDVRKTEILFGFGF